MDGRLVDHLLGVGAKRISATEAYSSGVSNGHELSAGRPVVQMLGSARADFRCDYLYLTDDLDVEGFLAVTSRITLYDAREKQPDRSPEWRLYYPVGCAPMESMEPGDYCWIARRVNGDVLVVVARDGSAPGRQLDRLFGTGLRTRSDPAPQRARPFDLFSLDTADDDNLDLSDADLLLALGITAETETTDRLNEMIQRFGGQYPLPTTAAFSAYAREVCGIDDPLADPDRALATWTSMTNDLYVTYERHVIGPLLDAELANREHIDVDTFFRLATRFKNARFSRAGAAFESHIAALLRSAEVSFAQPPRMPDGSKPDFLFPSTTAYNDGSVPDAQLTFLAAKTTTKERWRQVVTEASRLEEKFLITMDRQLNADVLEAMRQNHVRAVIPASLQVEYGPVLATHMTSVRSFIDLVRERESSVA